MAIVALEIKTELIDVGLLRLTDVTPGSSWGGANPARSDVDAFYVTLGMGAKSFTWQYDGSLTGELATGRLDLTAGLLGASLDGSCCIINSKLAFVSGPLNLRVQAIDRKTVTRYRSHYTVRLPSTLPTGAYVFVRKEGEWVDVTSCGNVVNGAWQYQVLDSIDQYTDWKLMQNGGELLSGTVLVDQQSSVAVSVPREVVVGEFSRTLFVVGQERQAWADLVRAWLDTRMEPGKPIVAGIQPKVAIDPGKLALLGQLLDALENSGKSLLAGGTVLDADTGAVLLKRLQTELSLWSHTPTQTFYRSSLLS